MEREERSKMVKEYYERNPEAKKKISKSLKQYYSENPMPKEVRMKISKAVKERMNKPEVKAKYSSLHKGKKRPEEVRLKIAKANRERLAKGVSEETKKRMSESAKKTERHKNVPEEVLKKTLEKNHNRVIPVEERLRRSGENSKSAKLTEAQAKEILDLYATGEYSYKILGKMYGISNVAIGNLVKGKTWKHLHGELEPIDLSTRRKK